MIKYKSRKDAFTITLYIVGILLSLTSVLLGLLITYLYDDFTIKIMSLMFIGITGAFLAALVCNVTMTEYTLFDDVFEVKGGFSRKHVTYKQIYALQRTKKIFCFRSFNCFTSTYC